MTVMLRSGGSLVHNAPHIMSPARAQDDSAEQHASSDKSAAQEEPEQPAAAENASILEAEDFDRRLADRPGGFQLLTLLVEDFHQRLIDRARRLNARDRSLQIAPPSMTTAAPTPPTCQHQASQASRPSQVREAALDRLATCAAVRPRTAQAC